GRLRLHVVHKLDDLRLTGRRVEIADEMPLRPAHAAGAGPYSEYDGEAGTLNRRRRNTKAIAPSFQWIKLRQPDRLPRRRTEQHHGAILRLAEHALARGADLV